MLYLPHRLSVDSIESHESLQSIQCIYICGMYTVYCACKMYYVHKYRMLRAVRMFWGRGYAEWLEVCGCFYVFYVRTYTYMLCM